MPKPMHVSPLQDMRSTYYLRATAPADKLHVTVACKHPELGNFFCATLDARKVDVADDERWAWLMPHRRRQQMRQPATRARARGFACSQWCARIVARMRGEEAPEPR